MLKFEDHFKFAMNNLQNKKINFAGGKCFFAPLGHRVA